ncbi:transglutaminase-like cysteine peptidase [Bradyrhizobium manausense]|uniref:transglutaminase-like cysteine peptidase n=1 Tax=Bradyrhizobium manausense TaxID=989370 RepID=UPI001BABE6B7|nr:transglutaminase-like cysteine peptidase [Bradyrhizobium manausense]MBR1092304.1 transglutaminase-like cysteine peptidase [Bradyrhizobium manausense]
MRQKLIWLAGILIGAAVGLSPSYAGLVGMPIGLQKAAQRIKFDRLTMPPMAYLQFCARYQNDCHKQNMFRRGPVRFTMERWAELKEVNQQVNRQIVPERNDLGITAERWLVAPERGDCNDYAVTKRHELLELGWPARALLLSEVEMRSGEHHLVLVVRTTGGDLVLDNLSAEIKPWSSAPYRWVRMQSPEHSRVWATIASNRV